jgi:DNA polymerase
VPILHRDFETRSTLKLRDVGAWRYATHAETDVWCVAFALDDGPVKLWVPGDPIPAEFIEAAQNPDWLVSAFNDYFERLIEQHIMGPRYGWPLIPIERHRCSQAAALALALPATLEKVAIALKLEQQKDRAGRLNMLKMAKPRKARAGEDPAGLYWLDDQERREVLYEYCKQDVLVERAIHDRIGFLSPAEQALWAVDQRINDRAAAIRIGKTAKEKIEAEIEALTAGAVTTVNQTQRLMAWLETRGCKATDVQKGTLRRALTRKDIRKRRSGQSSCASMGRMRAPTTLRRCWRGPTTIASTALSNIMALLRAVGPVLAFSCRT